MSSLKKKIVVCGATGNQGSSVVSYLLNEEIWEVFALTRNPLSESAKQLQRAGAKVVFADLEDLDSVNDAFEGADGVFGVTQPWSQDYKKCDINKELLQGENIIYAAKTAGISHLVFSSVLNISNGYTGVSHVDSKLKIEQWLAESDVPYTILRCAQFMQNIGSPFFPVTAKKVKGFISGDAKVPYVSCKDIGKIAARQFSLDACNKSVDLIGDFISGHELAVLIGQQKYVKNYRYQSTPKLLMRLFAKEFFRMRCLFEKTGRAPYSQSLLESIANSPATTRMDAFLKQQL